MHTNIDYTGSSTKAFDAVEDIKAWLGEERWNALQKDMMQQPVVQFIVYCSMLGINGYPVKAWYDLLHGEGAYQAAYDAAKAEYESKPKEPGKMHMLFG